MQRERQMWTSEIRYEVHFVFAVEKVKGHTMHFYLAHTRQARGRYEEAGELHRFCLYPFSPTLTNDVPMDLSPLQHYVKFYEILRKMRIRCAMELTCSWPSCINMDTNIFNFL